jgi:hypothetical protein
MLNILRKDNLVIVKAPLVESIMLGYKSRYTSGGCVEFAEFPATDVEANIFFSFVLMLRILSIFIS